MNCNNNSINQNIMIGSSATSNIHSQSIPIGFNVGTSNTHSQSIPIGFNVGTSNTHLHSIPSFLYTGVATSPNIINSGVFNVVHAPEQKPSIPIKIILIRKMPENMSKLFTAEDRECSICLEEIKQNEVYTTSSCFHMYHKDCLEKIECVCATCRK